jgi:hypothetical protein
MRGILPARMLRALWGMANKNRSKDSKSFADKRTLNPPAGGRKPSEEATSFPNPSNVGDERDSDHKIGQFTGRGSPGFQKK